MRRNVFFSFDWNDNWAVNQIRNIESFNATNDKFQDHADIEKIKRSTDESIKKWINSQLERASVTCVLIGQGTSQSKWVKYEIDRSYAQDKGILGIFIHNLKNKEGNTTRKGLNPIPNSFMAKSYDPTTECPTSSAYQCISNNIQEWVEYSAKQVGR